MGPSYFVLETLYCPHSVQIQVRLTKDLLSATAVPGIGLGAEDKAGDITDNKEIEPTSQWPTASTTVRLCSLTSACDNQSQSCGGR